jgi:hypothetical protein
VLVEYESSPTPNMEYKEPPFLSAWLKAVTVIMHRKRKVFITKFFME